MATIISTDLFDPEDLDEAEREWCYNGLDCTVTFELFEVLKPKLDNITDATYRFSKALQDPVLEMKLRGILVDMEKRLDVIADFEGKMQGYEEKLERLVRESVGTVGFNWRSNDHVKELFYVDLKIPIQRNRGSITVDKDALEKIAEYEHAELYLKLLLKLRDLAKKVSVLRTEIDYSSIGGKKQGRIHTSYNIGGTKTGRFSSSLSEFGTGGNLQNIEDRLRSVLIADPGMKMASFDAEQGENRLVGAIEYKLFGDPKYLDACESGDVHTSVSRDMAPDLPWTWDIKRDKKIAENCYLFSENHSLRKLCKSIGHASNYKGMPSTLHKKYRIEEHVIRRFQQGYFREFPCHLKWWQHVEKELRDHGMLISLMGRKRHFWARPDEAETLRDAIAFDPQGSLVDIVNQGMLKVWRAKVAQLLMQNHDAILVQYPVRMEKEVIQKISKLLVYPLLIRDREFTIPYSAKTGWNFGEYDAKTNPHGLKEWTGADERKPPKKSTFLDRPIRARHGKA